MNTRAAIRLWGRTIGHVLWDDRSGRGIFGYEPAFVTSGIQVAPFAMPLRSGPFEFPELRFETFKGLPGLLSDSLPDKFGNLLIDRWLAEQARRPQSFNPVERLCYIGTRGMGALEFDPETGPFRRAGRRIDIEPLVDLANRAITDRLALRGKLDGGDDRRHLEDILMIGTSAGGARAKAVIAWNEESGEFRSGQVDAGTGFSHWLLKFDGVSGNADKELADPQGFGRFEFAFYLLALRAGVSMTRCRLHLEGGRAHFMTRRFDRPDGGGKLHMQTLGAIRHFDFNQARAYSYEQSIETIRRLGIGQQAIEEQVRRTFLNIAIRNQDDHVKNIAFLMDRRGDWSLAPAYDVAHAWNPNGDWTSEHQMSMSAKTDDFEEEDLLAFGRFADLKTAKTRQIIDEVGSAMREWRGLAEAAEVPEDLIRRAENGFRWNLFGGRPRVVDEPDTGPVLG